LVKKPVQVILLSLSAACIAACGPSSKPEVSLVDVAQAAARQDDRASVEDLASWLIEGRGDFRLIDIRSAEDFANGKIGNAENIPIAEIVTQNVLQSLPTDRMLILYSNGSENAAKATVMLRLAGFDAHLLAGGYNAWNKRILNPDISAEELDGESLKVTAQRALSCYFVGERSAQDRVRRETDSAPFVPPVLLEEEDPDEPPPEFGVESC
jgi:rhodanese-related sulfurtransferase